jgi:putative oxygen-independent coproporphyrinogen III oxidase
MTHVQPPLSLYVHLPWCVRKCPYCDFNSHAARGDVPEKRYVEALLQDLAADADMIGDRAVATVFIGGGTPSLFHAESIARLLEKIRDRVTIAPDAEITLEANPGTVDMERFRGFREAGVNRLSIGVQSFDDRSLKALGRIHGRRAALAGGGAARAAGFDDVNLDLMYGLPDQDVEAAVADVDMAMTLGPTHVSAYELTLEPNTLFYRDPPALPSESTVDAIHDAIAVRLARHGFHRYEVSAYASAGRRCRHNRNYWEFGDYLGIGAGAHAKISHADGVFRIAKTRHPDAYLRTAGSKKVRAEVRRLAPVDLVCEFMLNALRLEDGFPIELFAARTGLSVDAIEAPICAAQTRGLLEHDHQRICPSPLGRRFLNDLIQLFVPYRAK